MKTKLTLLLLAVILINKLFAQDTLSVLFLGNSYSSYNNLPQLVQSLSSSAGKTLIIDSNMPDGLSMSGHTNNATTFSKISQGNWDYVILQEQSQMPTIDFYRYNEMYPAITDLKSLIEQYNPCAKIITYMTWGRQYGGQQCGPGATYCSPVFVDFNHMQDSLTSAYLDISEQLNIQCAPVGVTWQNILNDTTLILHSNDNSHPTIDGSYVAALTIYSSIWKQPSNGITFNAGLTQSRALYYQQMSDNTIFNSQNDWNLLINNPIANFSETISGFTATFTNLSTSMNNTLNYFWDFGDGNTSSIQNPSHTYTTSGTYTITLIASDCIFTDTSIYTIQIGTNSMKESTGSEFELYPNPTTKQLNLMVGSNLLGSVYTVYDNTAKLVLTGKISTENTSVDLGNLSAGLYLFRMGENFTQTVKVIKE
ncbi:MAG: PKD domain-containing protein [Crocinitomicaceae bacterium]|nr:PKD domain-containing protein [Crocinitomicaceae bacterium]